jgi:hypothetical protein
LETRRFGHDTFDALRLLAVKFGMPRPGRGLGGRTHPHETSGELGRTTLVSRRTARHRERTDRGTANVRGCGVDATEARNSRQWKNWAQQASADTQSECRRSRASWSDGSPVSTACRYVCKNASSSRQPLAESSEVGCMACRRASSRFSHCTNAPAHGVHVSRVLRIDDFKEQTRET